MTTTKQAPIDPGLFTFPSDAPCLLGSRCSNCDVVTFPRQAGCPSCSQEAMEDVDLDRFGKVWTWTTQAFRPKTPPYLGPETDQTFVPYIVGYVELAGQVKVEARLVDVTVEDVQIGMDVELAIVPFCIDGDTEMLTFAFRPRA